MSRLPLSGDGADELFSGYNKHAAEFKARNLGLKEQLVAALKTALVSFASIAEFKPWKYCSAIAEIQRRCGSWC